MAARAIGFEIRFSFLIENRLSHDRPSRIPCAKEQDVVAALHRSRALLFGSRTTGGRTASALGNSLLENRLPGANESARTLVPYLRCNHLNIKTHTREELARVFDFVD